MKIFLIFATLLGFIVSVQAQTEIYVSGIDVAGTENDGGWYLTFDSGSYDDLENTIDTNVANGNIWWWDNGDMAQTVADAANRAGLRIPHGETTISGVGDFVAYRDTGTTELTLAAQNQASQQYVLNASRVPAPFPILGILPVVGFLKRMRRRQKAS